jgi:hypothetical protein
MKKQTGGWQKKLAKLTPKRRAKVIAAVKETLKRKRLH